MMNFSLSCDTLYKFRFRSNALFSAVDDSLSGAAANRCWEMLLSCCRSSCYSSLSLLAFTSACYSALKNLRGLARKESKMDLAADSHWKVSLRVLKFRERAW